LVALDEIPGVADGACKAYSFQRAAHPNDTYVLIWAVTDPVSLRLPVPRDRLTLMRPFGTPLPLAAKSGETVVKVQSRRYLVFAGMGAGPASEVLRGGSRTDSRR
jgi:hypothetical protein